MDIYQREGKYPLPPGAPETLGVEFSGTIAEVGQACNPMWKEGDEVIGLASGVSASKASYTALLIHHTAGSVRRIYPCAPDQSHEKAAALVLDRGGKHSRELPDRSGLKILVV